MAQNERDQIVTILDQLTTAGAARWFVDPGDEAGYAYCFVGGERLDFVTCGPGGWQEPLPPESDDIPAILARWRHRELLFLEPALDQPRLLALIRAAERDPARFRQLTREATANATESLRRLIPK